MKFLRTRDFKPVLITLFFCVALTICCCKIYGQSLSSKPKLFAAVNTPIPFSTPILDTIFHYTKGQSVSYPLLHQYTFTGIITGHIKVYEKLEIVLMRSIAIDSSVLRITRLTNEDGSFSYRGTLLNPAYSDCLELLKNTAGSYEFVKKETDKVIQTCRIIAPDQ